MAYNDTEAAVIIRPGHRQKVGRTFLSLIQLEWHRYDLRTGQRIGNAIPLWSWEKRLVVMPHRLPLAALSLDGKRLAMRDPNDNSRVDVWDQDGKRLVGIVPYDPKTTIDWLGWGKDGKLLTLGAGRLMGWEIDGARAAYEVDGNYLSPPQIAPAGAWLALTGAEHVDLIDAATGKCLGRCQTSKAKGGWYGPAVLSPDGKALVRMRNGRLMDPSDPRRGSYAAGFVWDTTTGKLESVLDFGTSMATGKKTIHWTSPRQFLTIMSMWHGLVDLDARTTVCGYGMPRVFPELKGAGLAEDSPIRTGPGNRLWLASTNHTSITDPSKPWHVCHRLAFPDPKGKDSAIVPGRGRYVFHRGSPVRIEVDLGSAERSKLAAGALARFLQTDGFTIGKDGWCVRLTHAVFGSGATMQGNRGGGWEIPAVDLTWQVIDPAGKVFAEKKISRHFTERPSKYQTDRQLDFATGPKVITKYNFGRQDPKKAIAEEILDWCADTGRWPPGLAAAIVEMDGNRTPLPLGSQYRIDGD